MWRRTVYLGVLILLLGTLPGTVSARSGSNQRAAQADAVIALIDSGINPYHKVFRDDSPRARRHPSTYIPGFPKDAKAINLTFDAPDWQAAVQADCEKWTKVDPEELYWFPGTRIVGGISFTTDPVEDCDELGFGAPPILDGVGHGTMVASRAASSEYGACPTCLIVAVQGGIEGVKWAGDNSRWIDVQSNSWGALVPLWNPATSGNTLVNDPDFLRTEEEAARKHLSFWATGNGAATRGGVLGHPTVIDPRMTPPSIVMVGGHDSGYVNTWPDFPPHVVSDSCNCWAAYHQELDKSADTVGSGTSSATPFAAGGAARILQEARSILGASGTGVDGRIVARGPKGKVAKGPLADGRFTLEEWRRVLYSTATERPKAQYEDGPPCDAVDGTVLYSSTPVAWSDVPEAYPEHAHIGYGAVDGPAMKLAAAVLKGQKDLPDRSDVDGFFASIEPLRSAQYELYTTP